MDALTCKNCGFENTRWSLKCQDCADLLPLQIPSTVDLKPLVKAIFVEEFEVSIEAVLQVVNLLPYRQRLVIVLYFGLDGKEPITNMARIGREFFGVNRDWIRILRNRGLRFLRHASRSSILRRAKIEPTD